jgi:hypothetical protein
VTRVLILSAAFVAAVLLLDASGAATQILLGIATAGFVWLICRRLNVPAGQILCCVFVATTGEVLLSVVWGLYSYPHVLIPLYVPPGHALFYSLAVVAARQSLLQRHETAIVRTVLAAMVAMAVASLYFYGDTWGLLWSVIAIALIATSRHPLMLCACVTFTVMLEWAGTWNGNWRWVAEVPFVGLTSANPPSGVGLLYVVLDLSVAGIMRLVSGAQRIWLHAVADDGGALPPAG